MRDEYGPDVPHPVMVVLRGECAAQGMSMAELARLAGVGASTVSRAMSGRTSPTLETVDALAQVLGVELVVCPVYG